MTNREKIQALILELNENNVSDIVDKLEQLCGPSTFEGVARPLMEYMAKYHHPHTTAIVNSNSAELLEGIEAVNTNEYLVD